MALEQYLAEEIAQDCADGVLSRREALRRLLLLGVSATAAGGLLAACGGDEGNGGAIERPTTMGTAAGPDATDGTIRFPGPSVELIGAFSSADEPTASVLVIHENRGLTPHFFDLVGRFAAEGYAALCVDLLSEEGGTAAIGDEGAAQAGLGNASLERLLGDLGAGIDELLRRVPDRKVGAVGFCFGGGMGWNLLDAGEDRLAAVVPFYGPAPTEPDFSGATAAVLGVYAELDDRVNATRDRAEAALQAAGLTYEIRTFPGVDHAFFNDTGPRYDEAAATEAWAAVLDWFDRHLTP